MLRVLRKHLKSEPPNVRQRIALHTADMRDFRLRKKYPLVIIPFRPLQHMRTVTDQVSALTTASFHLQEKGTLAFDVFYPKFEVLKDGFGEEVLELEWPDPSHPNRTIRRYFCKVATDKIHQTFSFTYLIRTYEGDRLVLEDTESLTLAYHTYPHLRALFLLAGLEVIEEYGSFARTPLDNSATDMIFILRKS